MRTLDQLRAMFPLGAEVECVDNTCRPELNGTRRRIVRVQKQRLRAEHLSGAEAGEQLDMVLPARAGDVVEMTEDRVTYRLSWGEHTATFRVLELPTRGAA